MTTANLSLAVEAGGLRVTAGSRSYLYAGIQPELFLQKYRNLFDVVKFNFAPVEVNGETVQITVDRESLKQEVILNHLYFYITHRLPIQTTPEAIANSQTYRIVRQYAEAQSGPKSDRAAAIAAHLLNISIDEYQTWAKGDERFQNR